MQFVQILYIIVATLAGTWAVQKPSRANETTIRSPQATNWGSWGPTDRCPGDNTFVNAIILKIEPDQGGGKRDDTALNGVKLFCPELKYPKGPLSLETPGQANGNKEIISSVGPYGSWKSWTKCPAGIAVGFQLKSEYPLYIKKFRDDTAANDMKLLCLNGNGIESWINGNNPPGWGVWTAIQRCPKGYGICGLQTQVEQSQGKGDDTGLNNVNLLCCPLPDVSKRCVPTDSWKEIFSKNLTRVSKVTYHNFTVKIGLSYTKSKSASESVLLVENLSPTASVAAGKPGVSANFGKNLQQGSATGFAWNASNPEIWAPERSTELKIVVLPGCIVTFHQATGQCGPFTSKTPRKKRTDVCGNLKIETIYEKDKIVTCYIDGKKVEEYFCKKLLE